LEEWEKPPPENMKIRIAFTVTFEKIGASIP
jgi:hypothetical protein